MNTKQLNEVLEKAYFTLKQYDSFKQITHKIAEAVGYEPQLHAGFVYFKGTPVGCLAQVWRMIYRYELPTNTTDEDFDTFYNIGWEVYEALADTKSLTKEDTLEKVSVLIEDYSQEDIDEHTRTAFKMLEYDLTGNKSEWGKPRKSKGEV